MTAELSLADVRRAHERIAPHVRRTPVLRPDVLTEVVGRPTSVKLELLQHSGSFKARGAFARMLSLDPAARAAGVVAVSGGNHALAVAHAARVLGVRATVVLPSAAPRATFAEAERRNGRRDVRAPLRQVEVVAGQGTVALELVEQLDDVTDVVVPIGGGGLLLGTGMVLDALRPATRLSGVGTPPRS